MSLAERQLFPLVPRRRLSGLAFGEHVSRRRGPGSEVIGSRPYQQGDPVSTIDWYASARLSAATGQDEFIVWEHTADEAPRVVIVCDRRPAMALSDPSPPWLSKPAALLAAVEVIAASAVAARSDVGVLDFGGAAGRDGDPHWIPPGRRNRLFQVIGRQGPRAPFDAPDDGIELSLVFLLRQRSTLPVGSFVFMLSDFLVPPPAEALAAAKGRGWDLVPVVIQDPVWERSFPAIGSVVVSVADARGGRARPVRLSRREADERRVANEERFRRLVDLLTARGLEPVVLDTSVPREVDQAFMRWAEGRRRTRWRR